MFVLIVGAGKVGVSAAIQLRHLGHEVALVEQNKTRLDTISPWLEDSLIFGDGTEVWVLEKAGVGRADLVVAVTGDDEDNVIVSQISKLKYGVPKVVARVNNPYNQPIFDLLGVGPTVCGATTMLNLILHELPEHKFVHLLSLKREGFELVELEVSKSSPFAGACIQDIDVPDGVLLAAIIRDGEALVARGSTMILAGDYVLSLLPRGKEGELISVFLPDEEAGRVQDDSELDTDPED